MKSEYKSFTWTSLPDDPKTLINWLIANSTPSGCPLAQGTYSHVEGYGNIAINTAAHAEGKLSKADGEGAHAEGLATRAYGNGQHAEGKYNISDKNNTYAHIVGNGVSASKRSNAYTLDWNGHGEYAQSASTKDYKGGDNALTTPQFRNIVVANSIPEELSNFTIGDIILILENEV